MAVFNSHHQRGRSALGELAAAQVLRTAGSSVAVAASAAWVADYAWSGRTTASRDYQWRCWLSFCLADNQPPVPMTEGHVVAFIGWLQSERLTGTRKVAAASIPQYISEARTMHKMYMGSPPPTFPFVDVVIRAYKKCEDKRFPADAVRVGISSDIVQRIWHFGIHTDNMCTLRDCAMIVFSYAFNGLRESSVLSLLSSKVWIQGLSARARCSIWKGQAVSRLQIVAFHANEGVQSPMDIFVRWHRLRTAHVRFFALPEEPEAWTPGGCKLALSRILLALHIQPPPDKKYMLHSLRIGAHTEQVLLGIPLEARMGRFGWGSDSTSMAMLYFDRTIRLS